MTADTRPSEERLREAITRLDAPLDWDKDSPEDRLMRFVDDVRDALAASRPAHDVGALEEAIG